MHVLVAGASGYIGRHVVAALVARGHDVTALLRQAPDTALAAYLAGARQAVVGGIDTEHDAELATVFAGQNAVVSCIAAASGRQDDAWAIDYEMNRTLLAHAEGAGLEHFQLLSALCVQTPVLAFQKAKQAFENRLMASSLDWSIIRPTAFFKSLAGQIERVRAGKPFLLFGTGPGPACLPISEADLSAYMSDILTDKTRWNQLLPIGGPGEPITPVERGELLFAIAGATPRYRRIPIALVATIGWSLSRLSGVSRRAKDGAEFARIARFYATEPMLARDPMTGEPSAEATPQTGHDTLADFYARAWQNGLAGQHLGQAAIFERD